MPIEPEQFELPTRNNMVHETSIRERTEEEDDDLGLSLAEGENKDSAEMIREYTPLQYLRLRCLDSHWSIPFFIRPLAYRVSFLPRLQ
jgi:hypothetical protein